MLLKMFKWFLGKNQSEQEIIVSREWLTGVSTVALLIISLYVAYELSFRQPSPPFVWYVGGQYLWLGAVILLLRKNRTQLAAMLLSFFSLVGMFYAAYAFGGVRSPSYFGILAALLIIAMFLRGRVATASTILSIAYGWLLLVAEEAGYYQPGWLNNGSLAEWFVSTTFIFIVSVLLVAVAARSVRRLFAEQLRQAGELRQTQTALQEQTYYLQAFNQTTLAIINRLELPPLFDSVLKQALALVNTEHGYIDMLLPGSNGVTQVIGFGVFAQSQHTMLTRGEGLGGRVLQSGESMTVDDYQTWQGKVNLFNTLGFHALLAVPMRLRGQVIGILGLAYTDPQRKFSADQIQWIERFAELVSLAIENASLYQTAQDEIEQHRLTQQALEQSQENLRQALEAAHMGIWDYDLLTRQWQVSETAYEILGIQPETAQNISQAIESALHPRNTENPQASPLIRSLKTPGETFQAEYLIPKASQTTCWVEVRGKVYANPEGKPTRIAGTITDINTRKQAETALKTANRQLEQDTNILERRSALLKIAAEVSRAASAILNPDELSQRVVDLVQERFALYYVGLFLVEEASQYLVLRAGTGSAGQTMLQNNHKLPIANTSMVGWCAINRRARIALDVGEDAVRFSNPLLPDTRSEIALPLITRGQVLGSLTIQSKQEAAFSDEDIETFQTLADQLANAILNARLYDQLQTELEDRKRAEETVRTLNTELEERVRQRTQELQTTNKELEAFSYSVSHDLRAPLRALDGFSRILLGDYSEALPPEAQHYLNRIREASGQMGKLIDDLLRLSRITRTEMHFNPLSLTALAASIFYDLRYREPDRHVEIHIQENLSAAGDEGLLRVALENLLSNAWKFTSKTPNACIEVGQTTQNGIPAYYIRDNGVGFEMEYADKLFGAFQRLHSPQDFPGTGIGLAIVQRVIHKHGGRIWAEGALNQGATFYFTL